MVTIENLEVQFDVSGDGDEEVFARYFACLIEQWWQDREQEKKLEHRLRSDQMLGDPHTGGGY